MPRRARRPTRGRLEEAPLEGLPIVAVVGRPNVGKSTLFNRVVGERSAIVEDRPRTTRDRLYAPAEWNGRRFIVVDTGGLERRPGDAIEEKVQEQARLAIEEADAIVFVVDAAAGETPSDAEVAELLRTARVPVLVAINKADNTKRELEGAEFYGLGWEETYHISALHGRGVADLLDAIVWALPPESEAEVERKRREAEAEEWAEEEAAWESDGGAFALDRQITDGMGPGEGRSVDGGASTRKTGAGDRDTDEDPDDEGLDDGLGDEIEAVGFEDDGVAGDEEWEDRESLRTRPEAAAGTATDPAPIPVSVAIVGRPNVGKSSLLNRLLGEERAIVSDVPGTTRDVIDTHLEWNGLQVRLVDTAGMRRRGKVAGGPAAERFSALRALKAVSRADVAVLVLDAVDGLTAQDAHVAGYVVDEGKGLVIALNKWDLVEKDEHTFDGYADRIRRDAPFLDFAPLVAISAKTGQRVGRILEEAAEIAAERRRRVPTAELNRLLRDATFRQPAPSVKGKRPKFYYATQASTQPPSFVIFTSDASSVHFSYQRYLENRLRAAFGFAGTPIRLVFRDRTREQLERERRPAGPRGRQRQRQGAVGPAGSRATRGRRGR